MPLARLEAEELAGGRCVRVVAHRDTNLTRDDEQERRLLHLVLTHLLTGVERNQDATALAVLRVEDDRRTRAVGRLDLVELPVLHEPWSLRGGRAVTLARVTVVDCFQLGPLQTNCYVVRPDRGAPAAAVIDPGGDAADLRLELARLGTSCAAILVTHGHFDHLGGVADLAEGTGAEVSMPAGERDLLERYGEYAPVGTPGRAYTPERLLEGGETIDVAGLSFECVAIPGHSPAHVAFYTDGHLFSGDLIFAGSVGRTDLPGADWDTLLDSVRTVADRYQPETIVHPGHGPETTLGAELARNPFLSELRA